MYYIVSLREKQEHRMKVNDRRQLKIEGWGGGGTGDMAQWLGRALVLSEDLCSIPKTYMMAHNHL